MELNETNPRVPVGFEAFGPWFTEAFELLKAQWQTWVLVGLVSAVVMFVVYAIVALLAASLVTVLGFFGMLIGYVVAAAVLIVAYGIIGPGIMRMALKQIRGQAIAVGDIFAATDVISSAIVVMLAIVAGAIACGIGELVTATLFFLALPLVADKKLNYSEALKQSFEVTKQNFIFFLVYLLVLGIVSELGGIACGIGILFTLPIAWLGMAVAYERTFVAAAGPIMPQAAPPAAPPAPEAPAAPEAPEAPQPPADTPPPAAE